LGIVAVVLAGGWAGTFTIVARASASSAATTPSASAVPGAAAAPAPRSSAPAPVSSGAPPPSGAAAPPLAGAPSALPVGFAPDPAPLRTRHQWIVELSYREGNATFAGARRADFAQAITTPRTLGRFALELYVGSELLDRVRFDFPLLGADDFPGRRP